MLANTTTNLKRNVGWALILLSGIPWVLMFAAPWFPTPYPVVVTAILYGLSQLMWLAGIWCVGKEALTHIKSLLVRVPVVRNVIVGWTSFHRRQDMKQPSNIDLESSTTHLPSQVHGPSTEPPYLKEDCH